MNVDANIAGSNVGLGAQNAKLLSRGFEGLAPFLERSRELRQALIVQRVSFTTNSNMQNLR